MLKLETAAFKNYIEACIMGTWDLDDKAIYLLKSVLR